MGSPAGLIHKPLPLAPRLVLEDEVLDVDDPIGNVGAMDGDLLILRPVMKSMVNQVLPLVGLSQSGKELLTRLLGVGTARMLQLFVNGGVRLAHISYWLAQGSEDGNTEHAVRRILRKHSSLGSLPQHNQSSSKQEDDVHHEDWGSDLNVKRVDSMRSVADSHHGTPKSCKSNESGELEHLMDRLGSGNSFGSDYLSRPPSIPEHGDVPDGVYVICPRGLVLFFRGITARCDCRAQIRMGKRQLARLWQARTARGA